MIELLLEAEGALSVGLLDRAEILYRQVAAADPRNAIAVVGLARVTLERGDEPGALKLALRALAIDPENVAAQRMTQRLEEVLRYREAEVPGIAPPQVAAPQVGGPETAGPEVAVPGLPAEAARAAPPSGTDEPREAEAPPVTEPPRARSLIDRLLRRR
jgi:tetratricopeptide (TPR) repeat protein